MLDRRTLDRRQDEGLPMERVRMMGDWLKYLLAIAIASLLGYTATTNSVNARIAVLESKQQQYEQRLERIENKIDLLVARPER